MSGTHHLYTITGRALPNPPRRTPSRHSDILRLPTHRYDPTVDGSEGSTHRVRRIETPHGGEFQFISEEQRKASQLVPYGINEVNQSGRNGKAADGAADRGGADTADGLRGRKATAPSSTSGTQHKPRGRHGRKHSHRGHIAAPRLGQVPYADLSYTETSEQSSMYSLAADKNESRMKEAGGDGAGQQSCPTSLLTGANESPSQLYSLEDSAVSKSAKGGQPAGQPRRRGNGDATKDSEPAVPSSVGETPSSRALPPRKEEKAGEDGRSTKTSTALSSPAPAAQAKVLSSGTKKKMIYAPSQRTSEQSSLDDSLYAESTHLSGVVNVAATRLGDEAQLPAPTPHLQASQPRRSSPQQASLVAAKPALEEPMRATELAYESASRPRETLQQRSSLRQSPAAPPLFGLRPPSTPLPPPHDATPTLPQEERVSEKKAEAARGVSTAQVTTVASTHGSEAEKAASRARTRSELASYLVQPNETSATSEAAAEAARLARANAADSQFRRSPRQDTSYRPVLTSPASHGDRGVSPRRGSCSPGREQELTHEALVERIRRLSHSPRRSTSNSVGGTELLPPRPYLQGMQQVSDNRIRFTIVRFIETQPEARRVELYGMLKEYEGREAELCDALTDAFGEEFMEQKMLLAAA